MAETFDNQTFGVGNSTTGVLLGVPLTNITTFTGTNLVSGLTGVTIDGTIDQPGSPVQVALNIGGVAQASVSGTYRGFTQASPDAEPIYYFDTTVAGIGTPVTVAVSAGPVPLLSVASPINTTNVTAPDSDLIVCFGTGTQIRTARGEVAVESLKVGDQAVTASGALRPIIWIGHRTLDLRRHANQAAAQPIKIAKDAFAPGRPARDLFVSPGHPICVDVLGEVLIPALSLVNGATVQQASVESVTYWHVELDSHDILLAENLPAESYLDANDRSFFHERATAPSVGGASAGRCRPFFADGALVDVVRERLSDRAELLGWRKSSDMDVHLTIDGVRAEPACVDGLVRFLVPAEAEDVRLMSASFRPSWGRDKDDRRLSIAVSSIRISDGLFLNSEIAPSDERLADGFHAVESKDQWSWRWTTGCARLPRDLWADASGDVFLSVAFNPTASERWIEPADARHAEAFEESDNVIRLTA